MAHTSQTIKTSFDSRTVRKTVSQHIRSSMTIVSSSWCPPFSSILRATASLLEGLWVNSNQPGRPLSCGTRCFAAVDTPGLTRGFHGYRRCIRWYIHFLLHMRWLCERRWRRRWLGCRFSKPNSGCRRLDRIHPPHKSEHRNMNQDQHNQRRQCEGNHIQCLHLFCSRHFLL